MIWTYFSDKDPIVSGDYWIFRRVDFKGTPRIFMTYFSKRIGWHYAIHNLNKDFKKDWIAWIKIEKPKPPRKSKNDSDLSA